MKNNRWGCHQRIEYITVTGHVQNSESDCTTMRIGEMVCFCVVDLSISVWCVIKSVADLRVKYGSTIIPGTEWRHRTPDCSLFILFALHCFSPFPSSALPPALLFCATRWGFCIPFRCFSALCTCGWPRTQSISAVSPRVPKTENPHKSPN